ncbi:MAG: TlpA disulfide reductase family protein [Marinilabilia sp.]
MIHNFEKTFLRIFFLLSALTLNPVLLFSQEDSVRIFGQASEYSNYEIVFENYRNFINYEQEPLFTIELDENGTFDISRKLDHITYAFADMGRFRGFIYLEPGHEYHLKLPPNEELSQAERLNPFFEPEDILLGIANESQKSLNPLIRDFDEAFNEQIDKNAAELITSRNQSLASEIIDTLKSGFPSDHDFFHDHQHFRFAKLAMLPSRNINKDIIGRYFSDKPVMFKMPAYWEAFKDVFSGFGRKLFNKDGMGSSVSYQKMINAIQQDTLYQSVDLAESLAVWGLYEAYHEKLIERKKVLKWLKATSSEAATPEVREMASTIHERFNALRQGTEAPDFNMLSFSGETRSLDDYEGKFVYLNFVHTENHACRSHLNRIPRILDKFGEDLEVVTIILDEDYDQAARFVENRRNMDWDFLYFGMDANILKNYNVEAVPLYYLINPEGNLVLSPAPTPDENFHDNFVEQFRKYERKQQQQQSGEEESIFGK